MNAHELNKIRSFVMKKAAQIITESGKSGTLYTNKISLMVATPREKFTRSEAVRMAWAAARGKFGKVYRVACFMETSIEGWKNNGKWKLFPSGRDLEKIAADKLGATGWDTVWVNRKFHANYSNLNASGRADSSARGWAATHKMVLWSPDNIELTETEV